MADKNTKSFKFLLLGDNDNLKKALEQSARTVERLTDVFKAFGNTSNSISAKVIKDAEESSQKQKALLKSLADATNSYSKQAITLIDNVSKGFISEGVAIQHASDALKQYKKVLDSVNSSVSFKPNNASVPQAIASVTRPTGNNFSVSSSSGLSTSTVSKTQEAAIEAARLERIRKAEETAARLNSISDAILFKQKANINSERVAISNAIETELRKREEAKQVQIALAESTARRLNAIAEGIEFKVRASANAETVARANAWREQLALRERAAATEQTLLANRAALTARLLDSENSSFKASLDKQLQDTAANIERQKVLQLSGIHSIEAYRLAALEKEKQLIAERDRKLGFVSGAVSRGSLNQGGASLQTTKILQEHSKAILANNAALAEQEKSAIKAAEGHKFLHNAVRNTIALYAVFVSLKNTVGAVGQKILDVGIELDSTKASLLSTSGSMARVDSVLVALDKEAERTGISVGVLRENFRNLSASMSLAGESAETQYKVFTNLNTVSTALHLTSEKTQGVFLAVAQIFNKSKVQSEELVKQLGNLLPGAFAAFATATGRSTQQLSQDMKKGLVYAHDTVEDFTTFMANRFAKAFELSADNVNANIGRMNTSFIHLSETIYGQTNGAINSFVKTITQVVNATTEVIAGTSRYQAIADQLGVALTALAAGTFISWLSKTTKGVALADAAIAKTGFSSKGLLTTLINLNAAGESAAAGTGRFTSVLGKIENFYKANFLGLLAIGVTLLASEFGKAEKQAEKLNEYLGRMAKARKILADSSNLDSLTKEQRIDFKVSNDEGVKSATENLLKAKEVLLNFTTLPGLDLLPDFKKRLAARQAEFVTAHDNLIQESKRAKIEINALEDTAKIETESKERALAESVKAIHDDLDQSIQGKITKRFRDYKTSIQKEIDDLEAIIQRGEPKLIRDSNNKIVGEKARLPEEVAAAERAKDMLAQVWKDSTTKYEQINAEENQKILKADDTFASKQIELTKKKFAELERAAQLHYDKENLLLEAQQAQLELKQKDYKTASSDESAIQQKIALLDKQRNLRIEELRLGIGINSAQRDNIDNTAAEVQGLSKKTEGFEKLVAVMRKLEGGSARAVSPTGALGIQQVQPSTLKSFGVNVPDFILQGEAYGKANSRRPGGKYVQAIPEGTRSRMADWAEKMSSEIERVSNELLAKDYQFFKQDAVKTLAAYNAGRGSSTKGTGVLGAIAKGGESGYIDRLPPEAERYARTGAKLLNSPLPSKAESSAVVEDMQSITDEGSKQLAIARENQTFEIEKARLLQEDLLNKREQTNEILQQKIQQLLVNGQLVEAAKLQNKLEFGEKELVLSKTDVSVEQKTINQELLKGIEFQKQQNLLAAQQEELIQQQSARMAELNLTFAKINQQQTLGKITDFEAIFERQQAAKEKLPGETKDVEARIAIIKADKNLSPAEQSKQIADLEQPLIDLKTTAEGVSTFFQTNLTQSLTGAFMAYADKSKTATEATIAFGQSVARMIGEIILQKLALLVVEKALLAIKVVSSMFGFAEGGGVGAFAGTGTGAGSGAGTFSAAITPSFSSVGQSAIAMASGGDIPRLQRSGMIKGRGSETSDDIVASVPLGSFILNAKAARMVKLSNNELFINPDGVKKIGLDKLHKLNDAGKYAEGGYVNNVVPISRNVNDFQQPTTNNRSSVINQISVNVNHTGKEKSEELGSKIGVEIMKKIAKQEVQSGIAIYDKTKRFSSGRSR